MQARTSQRGNALLGVIAGLIAVIVIGYFVVFWLAHKRVTIDPGFVGLQTDKPMFIGNGGVRDDVLQPGGYWVWESTDVTPVDVTPKTISIRLNDFVTSDNTPLDFESAIQVQPTDVPLLYKKFQKDWFKHNVEAQYIAYVRNQIKSHSTTSIMTDTATGQAMDDTVTQQIRKFITDAGIPVHVIGVTLGKAIPNKPVLDQMDATAAQQQRIKTMDQARLAEIERKKQQEAEADADNAYRNKLGLTPDQYLAKQIAEIQAKACAAAKACYIVPQGTSVVAQ